MYLVDSHAHLHLLEYDYPELDNIIRSANENHVQHLLNVCVSLAEFPNLVHIAERYNCVSLSVGLHPNTTDETVDEKTLIELAKHPKVVAIGETGLDYFRSTGDVEWQRERFRLHIRSAKQLSKPIIVHTRAAKVDTIEIMRLEDAANVGGVMHCFTEDWEMAKQALDLGFYISFSGIVTFSNAKTIQEVAKQVPLDKILIETDCPYLAPEPMRGKPNQPANVRYTAEFIAKLRNVSLAEFADITTSNFFTLFKEAEKSYV